MAEQKNVQEQDINQLRKVRREKFADLQANGKDPFRLQNMMQMRTARRSKITLRQWKERKCLSQDVSCLSV